MSTPKLTISPRKSPEPLLKQVVLTDEDKVRLAPHLASSGKLNEMLMLDTVSDEDLKKMLAIEAMSDNPRSVIVKKLLGRYFRRQHTTIYNRIFNL